MKALKTYFFLKILISALFGVGVGLLLLVLAPYASELLEILIIAIGLLTFVLNIPALLLALKNIRVRGEWVNLVIALLSITIGVLLMLLKSEFLLILITLYAIVLPLVRVILAEQHARQLRHELLPFLTGLVVVVVFLAEAEAFILRCGAYVAFAVSAFYFLHGMLVLRFRFTAPPQEESEPTQATFTDKTE